MWLRRGALNASCAAAAQSEAPVTETPDKNDLRLTVINSSIARFAIASLYPTVASP
jgi:hypothetical protein